MSSKARHTKSTACSSVIMNRVIRGSVIGSARLPATDRKKGITEPREPIDVAVADHRETGFVARRR